MRWLQSRAGRRSYRKPRDRVASREASNRGRTAGNRTMNDQEKAPARQAPGQGRNETNCGISSTSNAGRQAGNHAQRLKKLLGNDAVLLWLPLGFKRPDSSFTGWQKTTISDTLEPAYQAKLAEGNIGVLVGDPSGGICSIDIDHDDEVEPFLELNPILATTLRSKGKRGCNLWVQMAGDYPKAGKLVTNEGGAWGEWRSTGNQTVIHGKHPDGMDYRLEVEARPIRIHFADIVWPDSLKLPWEKSLSDIYGPPVFTESVRKGDVVTDINEGYWAGLYDRENIVLHDPDERAFYRYDERTGLFSVETADRIKHDISARMLEASRTDNIPELVAFRRDSKLNAVVAQLRGIAEKPGAFENRPQAVHLANCVLRLTPDGLERHPFSPSFRSRNRSPIIYDLAAKCPRFLNELVIPAVKPDDVVLLQKMVGQALLGRNLVQRLVILDGLGGRGKTQLLGVIQHLVGQHNFTELRTRFLADRFELYKLRKSTVLTGVDVKADFLSAEGASVLKGLVGGDWFDAEKKGGTGSFKFQGSFNVFVTSNARLKVRLEGDISAWRRRLLIVRYEGPPPARKIPDFAELLIQEEGSGILNWALEGLLMLMEDINGNSGDLVLTDRQKGVVDALLAESDSLRHFLESRVKNDYGSDLAVEEIVEAYADYCPEMGWNPAPVTEIQRDLPSLMLELFRTSKSNDIRRNEKSRKGFHNVAFIQ
jgi:phage/plasmid-associated DNA primase